MTSVDHPDLLAPQQAFLEFRQWFKLHDGFGLAYVFSDDTLSMRWLRARIEEELALASAPLPKTLIAVGHIQDIANFFGESFGAEADQKPTNRCLLWLEPDKSEALNLLRRLNERRQQILKTPHLYIVCLPLQLEIEAARNASDLWSVRSFVLHAQGQGWRSKQSLEFNQSIPSLEASPPAHGATASIRAWQSSYANWLASADGAQRPRLSIAVALQAMQDAQELRYFSDAKNIAKQADAIAVFQNDDWSRANILQSLGELEQRLGQVDSARARYTKAIALYEKEQNDLGRANALQSLGNLDRHLGQVDSARTCYTQAITLFEKERADLGRANVLQSLGDLDRHLGQIDSARTLYTQAITLFEKEKADLGRANALWSLGYLDLRLGHVDSARTLYKQAISLYEKEQNDLGRANALHSLGNLDSYLGQDDSARTLYTQAIALFENEKNDLGRANTLQSLGNLDSHLGQINSARMLYAQAIALFEKEQNVVGLAYTWASLARLNTPPDAVMVEKSKAYALQSASPLVINDIATLLENHPLTH